MSYQVFKDTISQMKAHGLAVERAGARQAEVTVQFKARSTGAAMNNSVTVPVCWGHCRKCDKLWITLRQYLSGVKMVHIGRPKAPAPSEAKPLAD